MSKEIEDEFYCGTDEKINESGHPIVITKRRTDAFYEHEEYMIEKAQEKFDRISDSDFVRLWQNQSSIFDFLEELQYHIGCLFTGTSILRCIDRRAKFLRKHGVKIREFTI